VSYFPVFTRYCLSTFTVPDARHGGRGRAAGYHCLHQRPATERLCGGAGERPDIPRELRRRYRGCRAGGRRRRRYRPYLPSIVMGNVQSLVNKMDELTSLTRSESVFWEGSVLCFTETWLHDNVPDTVVDLAGFQLVRADRELHRERQEERRGSRCSCEK